MRSIRVPTTEPGRGVEVLTWARQAQQTFREIKSAFGDILPTRTPPPTTQRKPAAASHPFQVLKRQKPSSTTIWQAKVVLESSLYDSFQPNDKISISELDAWFDLIGTDAIWLGVVFDRSGAITSAGIDSWGQDDLFELDEPAWSNNNGYCEDDQDETEPRHQATRKLIAYTVEDEEGEPIVTQAMYRDQVLEDRYPDGRPARLLFDHEGGYPL